MALDKYIPRFLKGTFLKPCCDVHDVAYGTIGKSQESCDNEFDTCLKARCDEKFSNGLTRVACKSATAVIVKLVESKLGVDAYKVAQLKNGCP